MTRRSPCIVVATFCCLLAIGVTGLFIWPLLAFAWNEPDSFRGVPWGASLAQLQAHLEQSGEKVSCLGSKICSSFANKIGPVVVTIHYFFAPDGTFEMVHLSFAPRDYSALRAIFEERYGAPTNVRTEEAQTRMGAKFTNEVAVWEGERVVINLRRYSTKITEGLATLTLKSALERRLEDAKKSLKKGKDDL